MQRFRRIRSLQKFAAVHASDYNHFNHERSRYSRQNFKATQTAATRCSSPNINKEKYDEHHDPPVRHQLTALAAECFTLARIAATGIEEDVLDLALPAAKQIADALLAHIRRGTILNGDVLTLLEELIDAIEDEIDDGTRCITRYDHSPENVSANTSWQETSYSP